MQEETQWVQEVLAGIKKIYEHIFNNAVCIIKVEARMLVRTDATT